MDRLNARKTRVLVADGNTLCRAGLIALLQREIGVAGVFGAEDVPGIEDLLRDGPPVDLLVLDAELPGLGGAAGLRRLAAEFPSLGIVVVAARPDLECVEAAPGAGARGCLLKDRPDDEIVAVLRAILNGQAFVSATPPPGEIAAARAGDPVDALTSRQRSVVEMLASGRSNKEIGSVLGICEGTVKVHLLAAFRQMGVRNRVQAVTALRSRSEQPMLRGLSAGCGAR
jgi:DNA-binding NarL/FixJ family response regulator